ncbi:FAD:protein FMN transferase [Saccharibacillus sp. CPCC 101409]|uniref:FAD:protein FMN transferase n=1 Tax=Saccharibacillus sp. CPCC 101409 TaxID=3058041 RepID=UPI002671EC7F|nr:FAD:protein FMN transferase [Saccharibacillus sp. CPCC 101409]MDO3411499.1 FAD:protein FMN transferase [Saccharibacillus sp. CPCC 101409]
MQETSIRLMGTVIQIALQHPNVAVLLTEAEKRLADYEQRFSANNARSDLMRINRQAGRSPVSVDADLFELIHIGQKESLIADSLLNIAIGPLIKAWRIGFADARHPSDAAIRECLQLIDPRGIMLDEERQSVFLQKEHMEIDLGALAKGYFADKIVAYFKQQNAASGFIDLGGNVLTFGNNPAHADGLWRVGIQNPRLPRGNFAILLKIRNQSIVTSGIYERKLEISGRPYHHIFDSRTGYPVQSDVASLTIVSEESLAGEIWSTRLFGKSAVEIIRTLNMVDGIEGVVITDGNELAVTSGLHPYLERT